MPREPKKAKGKRGGGAGGQGEARGRPKGADGPGWIGERRAGRSGFIIKPASSKIRGWRPLSNGSSSARCGASAAKPSAAPESRALLCGDAGQRWLSRALRHIETPAGHHLRFHHPPAALREGAGGGESARATRGQPPFRARIRRCMPRENPRASVRRETPPSPLRPIPPVLESERKGDLKRVGVC